MSMYAGPTAADLVHIPAVLTARPQWVLWQGRPKPGHPDKLDKVPMNPTTLTPASTTDALTWGTFGQCCAAMDTALEGWEHDDPSTYRGGGIGYVFVAGDPYTGIDLDACVNDVTGAIADWAHAYVETLASYTEITPSQQGLHILVEGTLPAGRRRHGGIEMYDQGRFFTVTGWHLDDTPASVEDRHLPLTNCWYRLFGPQVGETVRCLNTHGEITNAALLTIAAITESSDGQLYATFLETATGWPLLQCERETRTSTSPPTPSVPDYAILAKAFSAANASKFSALWAGDWRSLGYPSQSEADYALCGMLRFWTQDPAQLDRLMRQSGLMRAKWDTPRGSSTWGAQTIAAALNEPHEHYVPPPTLIVTRQASVNGQRPYHSNGNGNEGTNLEWGIPTPALQITDLADMLERTYPLPLWLIKDLIPEGLIFFIGSPKSSKTYLGYSLALSLAYESQRGGLWLDHYPINHAGPVVYVTLEDDEADSRYRIAELAPWLTTIDRGRLLFVHGADFPRFDQGLVEVLRDQVLETYHPSLVVLDPISYLYSPLKKSGDQFSEVRDMLLPLRWLGRTFHCTIAGVDHRRKKSADDIDIFETQYGSVSKGAVADAMFVIVRDDKEITLHARIRKAADQTLTLGFEFNEHGHALWTWKGAVEGLVGQGQYGDLRQRVLDALSGSAGVAFSIPDILAGLNMPDSKQTRNATYQILFRAQKSGEVQKTTRGQYMWAGGN